MPTSDDMLKKYQEAGAEFLESARTRAEEFLNELSKVGDSTQSRAQEAFDELREGSRRGTEQLIALIRREVNAQLGLLGIATKDDLAALERRLKAAASKTAPAAKKAPAKKAAAKKAAAKKAPASKAAAKKA